MTQAMNSMQRVHAALKHKPVDRVPVSGAGWVIGARAGGFTEQEYANSGEKMAKGQLAFWEKTGVDLLHPMSDVGQMAAGWGVKMRYEDGLAPMLDDFGVKEAEQWEEMEVLDPKKDGRMHVPIEAIALMRKKAGNVVSIMPYIPSAITSATHVRAMEEVLMDILLNPDLLKKGLKTMTETITLYGNELFNSGADGLLFATTRASAEIVTLDQYEEFGAVFDRQVLKSVNNQDGYNILHVCGVEPFFELLSDFPNIGGINWWDRGSNLSIADAKAKWGKKTGLVAGINQTTTLMIGSMKDIEDETKDAINQGFGDGTGLVICPGCEISPATDYEKIKTMVRAAEKYGKRK